MIYAPMMNVRWIVEHFKLLLQDIGAACFLRTDTVFFFGTVFLVSEAIDAC